MKKTIFFISIIAILGGCANSNPDTKFDENYKDNSKKQEEVIKEIETNNPTKMIQPLTKEEQLSMPNEGDEIAVIETSMGTIKLKFFKDHAPELTKNFIELSNRGYYTNAIFHRVIKGFVIQSGDPTGTGRGGESYKGKGLADEKGALILKHYKGAVACAKSSLPNSIGSQFYIAHDDIHSLDGNYSVFGQVFEGQDIVDIIATQETDNNDKPITDIVIKKVTITSYN